jgi:AAA+ superfamily predicted ATPase
VTSTGHGAHTGIDEPLLRVLEDALAMNDLVVLDDAEHLAELWYSGGYARRAGFDALLREVMSQVWASRKRLVVAWTNAFPGGSLANCLPVRALNTRIDALEAADFAALLEAYLGADDTRRIDVDGLFDYAPALNIQQLRGLAAYIGEAKRFDAKFVQETLSTRILATNTRLEEVEDISFDDLKGFEHIAEALTTYVLNPLRGDERLKGLDLCLKRGVLIYGPPGTGKTSVGRALARQMQGKFFLIDGTFSPEPAKIFFQRITEVISQAKAAAPCVLFIDDADVLLESGYAPGYSRYLLSLLDGLESRRAGKIAVILTAMDPSNLPPALLRSGRVELWLETKTPPDAARADIVADHVASLPENFRRYDVERLTDLTSGFNAADMRRVVADVKALYAKDVIAAAALQDTDAYLAQAIGNVRHNKRLLQLAAAGEFAPAP